MWRSSAAMAEAPLQTDPADNRVKQLADIYGHAESCVAGLLCDRYAPSALAYRVVAADLTACDYTYGELRAASEQFAGALHALGVKPGDRVATLMGKSWAYLVTLMGIWRLGAVHVPLFTAFAPPAIALRLQGSGAKVVVCDPTQRVKLAPSEFVPAGAPWRIIATGEGEDGAALSFDALLRGATPLDRAAALGPDAPIIHIYTSGTTGNPKGVVVPARAIASFRAYAEFGLGLQPDDLYWCAADPGWAYGLYFGIIVSLSTGVPSLLFEVGFTPESTFTILANHHVTNFAAAPTVYRGLRGADLPIPPGIGLRCASSAGEPLTPEVNEWAQRALGVVVHDHYGQTEAGMLINNHHHPLLKAPIKPGSMGRAMPGWVAVVLEEERDQVAPLNQLGRIAMDLTRSPFAWFKGYEGGDPAKSAEKFAGGGHWYVTGDTGLVDEEGYFHFSSRDDDVIIMAGYRIGPFEVESVLLTHEAVAEAGVIGAPDAARGEVIEAYVVLRGGAAASPDLARDIQQWVKTRYAAHAYPRAVHFVEALPKTPSGKIQRFVLKQQRRAELGPAAAVGDAS